MPEKLIIVGMGEHGRIMEVVARSHKLYDVLGYVDDRQAHLVESETVGKCLGKVDDLRKLANQYPRLFAFVAIGRNTSRELVFRKIEDLGIDFANIIHPSAVIEATARIGRNVFIGANAVVNNSAVIGNGVYINTGCIVEHDNNIGNFVHMAPGVVNGGGVKIGRNTFIGLGCVINDHLTVGEGVFIASGSVVTKNLEDGGQFAGVPAAWKNSIKNRGYYQ